MVIKISGFEDRRSRDTSPMIAREACVYERVPVCLGCCSVTIRIGTAGLAGC